MSQQIVEAEPGREAPANPDEVYQAMLASIARTAFSANQELIPYFPDSRFAASQVGQETHTLTIVGNDTVRSDGHVPQELTLIASRSLLGTLITSPGAKVLEVVAFRQAQRQGIDPHQRLSELKEAHQELEDVLTAANGDSLVASARGSRGETTLEIPDTYITDARRSITYKEARFLHSVPLFMDFIAKGGILPNMTEIAVLKAAKSALQQASGLKLTKEMHGRFRLLNEIIASVQYTRTEDYVDKNPLHSSHVAQKIRATLAEALSPAWQSQGLCKTTPGIQHLFFPPGRYEAKSEREKREKQAKQSCEKCPVQKQCLESALAQGKVEGVWGNTNVSERAKILRTRQPLAN